MTNHRRQLTSDLNASLTQISLPYQCRKSALSFGIWNSELKMIEIIHQHRSASKAFLSMGVMKDSKLYLHPEEAIFLMQCSLLQVSSNANQSIPISLDEAYSIWLNGMCCTLSHLHVYQYLTRLGFILIRHRVEMMITERMEDVRTNSIKRKREEESIEELENESEDENVICPIHSASDCQRQWFPDYTSDPPLDMKHYPRLTFPDHFTPIHIDWLPPEFQTKVSNVRLSISENKIFSPRPSYSLLRSIDLHSHSTIYQRLSSFTSPSHPSLQSSSTISFDLYTPRKHFRKRQPGLPDYYLEIKHGNEEFHFDDFYNEQSIKTLTAVVHNGDVCFIHSNHLIQLQPYNETDDFFSFFQMLVISSWSLGLIIGFVILNWLRKRYQRSRLHAIARQCAQSKRLARDKRRDELLHLFRTKYARHLPNPDLAQRISQSTTVQLLQGFRQKDFTYSQVVLVLSLRALKIGQMINCTSEEFFDQAMDYAERLDQNADQDELLLKGIPVSIKDHIDQQGADSSMGISMRNFRPSLEDSLILQLLKEQGALAGFVRTTTIQGMMLPDTLSETYGVGQNPFDLDRTPGGSSGGEGALIAARGSPLGIGSDIGGSIRIPAHFCGVFGFKPTPGRVTNEGVTIPSRRQESGESNIRATIGPLARCTDDLVLVMRSLLQETAWLDNPELARQPWRNERFEDKKRLTIGYYTNDQWFPPAPACIRAVNEAAQALRQLGHTVIPYTPIDIPEAVRLFVGIIGADGNRHFLEALENEEINPLYTPLLQAAKVPNFLRPFIARVMRLIGERRNAMILQAAGSKSAYEYFELIIDLKKYIKTWLADLRKNNINLLLTPVNGLPAYRHDQSAQLFLSCSYTFLFNILHLPAGVVPMTVVRDDEQYYEDIGNLNNDIAVRMAKDVCRGSAGLPIGIQLVGWPNDDERVLGVMKELEEAIGKVSSPMPNLASSIDIYTD